ncbi:MAG: phosphate ABC transporter substrate-binding protein [Dehalococcoidales bacterium]|jgi:phosphate transport system substrate-binding protein
MKKSCLRWLLVLVVGAVCLLGAGGCQKTRLIGTINEAGSTTVQPVAEKLAQEFMNRNPDVNIIIQGGGSSEGIRKAAEGSVDLGAASRNIKAEEPELITHLIGHDGIAVIVHPNNPVNGLTREQVIKIFSGEIKNWRELGGSDSEITIVSREGGSGTRACFEEMVMGESQITDKALFEPSNGAVRAQVSTTPSAIGYLSLGYIDNTTKALSIDGVACTVANCKSHLYPIVRPLYFLTKDAPEGIVKAFIEFSLSGDGQKIVVNEGYLSND